MYGLICANIFSKIMFKLFCYLRCIGKYLKGSQGKLHSIAHCYASPPVPRVLCGNPEELTRFAAVILLAALVTSNT
jgi:hypothetical protein